MSRSEIDVARLARLARLALTEPTELRLRGDLERIVRQFEHLRESARTSSSGSIEPLAPHTLLDLRADEPRVHPDRDAILANAPRESDGHFSVPRVIE